LILPLKTGDFVTEKLEEFKENSVNRKPLKKYFQEYKEYIKTIQEDVKVISNEVKNIENNLDQIMNFIGNNESSEKYIDSIDKSVKSLKENAYIICHRLDNAFNWIDHRIYHVLDGNTRLNLRWIRDDLYMAKVYINYLESVN